MKKERIKNFLRGSSEKPSFMSRQLVRLITCCCILMVCIQAAVLVTMMTHQYVKQGKEDSLNADRRTVVLTLEDNVKDAAEVAVTVSGVKDTVGNETSATAANEYYKNETVVTLGAATFDGSAAETKAAEKSIDGKEGFTVIGKFITASENATILEQKDAYKVSIKDGYLVFELNNGLTVQSDYTVKTLDRSTGVVSSEDQGMIADGEVHAFAAVKEINGMIKLYIDGRLVASAYDEAKLNPVLAKGELVFGEGLAAEGPAGNATDDNTNTIWHTDWHPADGNTYDDHWLQLELDGYYAVSGFNYLPRQDTNSNGDITDYKILVSVDGENWEVAAEGTFNSGKGWSEVEFEAKTVKYVRLKAENSLGDQPTKHFSAAAEVRVVGVPTTYEPPVAVVDKTALEEAIAAANALNPDDYEDFTAVVEAIFAGSDVVANEDATQEEVARLYGDSRYDTGYAVADALKEVLGVEKFEAVIVATGKTFADSLSASAAKLPILLVKPNAALNDAQKEILAGRKNIYIVGGEGAVSVAYAEELAAYGEVTRVFGDSRYDTSVEIAKTFCTDAEKAVVASGKNFPDGLCGGPLAAALNAPLVLTKDGGAAAAAAYVADNAIASGFVLGGEGALADETVVEVFALESADEIK